MENKKKNENGSLVMILIIAIIVVTTLVAMSLSARHNILYKPIIKIGNIEVAENEYNFCYTMSVNNFTSLYSQYLSSIGLNISEDFSEQECSFLEDGGTWADFFQQTAIQMMQEKKALYNESVLAGYSVDVTEQYAEFEESIKLSAQKENVTVGDMYKKAYGNYATRENIKELFLQYAVATEYEKYLYEQYLPSETDILDYYEKNTKNFDRVSYMDFIISAEDDSEESVQAAKEKAQEFYDQTIDEKSYLELCETYSDGTGNYVHEEESYDEINSAISEWLFGNLKKNDVSIIQENTDFHIVYFLSRQKDESNTVDFRHILISPDTSSSASYLPSEEDYAASKKEAEKLLIEWEKENTEDNFAKLANEYSDDKGSNTNGGIYRSVEKGELKGSYDELDAWLFSNSRQPKDIEILKSDYGYHIVYFVSKGEPAWRESIIATLKESKLQEEKAKILESYPVEIL